MNHACYALSFARALFSYEIMASVIQIHTPENIVRRKECSIAIKTPIPTEPPSAHYRLSHNAL